MIIMKKIYLLFIILLLFPTIILASTNTKSREGIENYGVTKYEVTPKNKKYVLDTPYVDASEKLYDFAEILTDEEEQELYDLISGFNEKTGFDLVILTKSLPYTDDQENEDYATDFYDFNDFNKNGILFFRNDYEEDRYFDLYSFGDAQLYYYDTRLSDLLDEIFDEIRNKEYLSSIKHLISRLNDYYDYGKLENYFVDNDGFLRESNRYYIDENGKLRKIINYQIPILPSIIISAIISLISVASMVKKNKMIRNATDATVYVDEGNINILVKRDELVNSITNRTYIPPASSSSGGGGGHSSSSGHSGGGHSSGGGRHG